ncbi:MAG TPA: glycosyltransferase family 2 protein [Moraxellaceae bacterium]
MKRVDVLLATYNGARHLREQIDSVLAQQGVSIRLRIRDDGSSDATPALLQEYASRYPDQVEVLPAAARGEGAARNFLALLALPSDADYFALCDQDDVWPADRLAVAVNALEAVAVPVRLYCSAVEYVDESLQSLGISSRPVAPSFANALVENIAQGCTMVGDAALRDLVGKRPPEKVAMHDWWLYLLAAAFGRALYDPVPRVRYRQHGANAVGGGFSLWRKLHKNWVRYTSGRAWPMAAQAQELLRLYPERLDAFQRDMLARFVAGKRGLPARLRLAADWRIRRQSLPETLVVKLLIIINAY